MLEDFVAVGGTFDHFHIGHIQLLLKCFEIGKHVVIGITSDSLIKGKNHVVEPIEKRKNMLISFIQLHGLTERAKIIELNDYYGPTIHDETISAIVVSEETLRRAIEINKIRIGKGFKPLKIFYIPLVKDVDLRSLSSTKLRRKEKFCEKFLFI